MQIDLKLIATMALSITLARVCYSPTASSLFAFGFACALLIAVAHLAGIEEKRFQQIKASLSFQIERMQKELSDTKSKVEQMLMRGGR